MSHRRRAVMVGAVLFLASCSFERRPEVGGEEESGAAEPRGQETLLTTADPSASAIETLAVFREAVALGDLSLALALLDREVVLLDRLIEVPGRQVGDLTRGELLLELRRIHGEGLELRTIASEVALMEGAALVVTRLALLRRSPDSELAREVARADETALLMLTPEGWRIRHLHRSLVPDPVARR